jgi:hypothetical protein
MANIVVSALSTFNNKGLKKGKKEISAFEKQVKAFSRTFVAAFSVTALTRFGKEAVKAFVADEKAAKSLEVQLKNTGYQFSSPAVELYIANLQKTTGVLDDQLRPAFQQLLTVTGSITMSQDALNTALNVSAATGQSLSQVTSALSRGYAGNTTALTRLGVGLDKALLKTGDMDAIMAKLNEKFSGQSSARLETYAGKMDLLKVASENAKEEIGKGILDALSLLGKDKGIETATGQMEDFGTSIGNAIYGMGKLIDKVNNLGVVSKAGGLGNILLALQPGGLQAKTLLSSLSKSGARPRELPANEQRSAGRIFAQQFRTEVKQKKEMERLRAQELAALKKKTAVDELKEKFDIELIGLQKARNEATDQEIKLRLNGLIAIAKNDEALAKKALAELAAAEAAQEFAKKFSIALEAVRSMTDKINQFIAGQVTSFDDALESVKSLNARIAAMIAKLGTSMTVEGGGATYNYALAEVKAKNEQIKAFEYNLGMETTKELNARIGEFVAQQSSSQAPTEIRVTVDANSDRLSQAIAESIQVANRSGYSTVPAGFIV